jgi:2,7-dihydroxy-5-methyl-1-naphthoate 7-O-methyltransferase
MVSDKEDVDLDLAAAAGCDQDALHAVLGHLVAQGVFTESSPGKFAVNRAAERLEATPFVNLDGFGGRMSHTWGTLLDYVRTGQPAYEKIFGRPFWEDLAAHPEIAAEFDALMGPAGHGVPDYDVELSRGWETVRTVVDVGGRVTLNGQSFFDPLPVGADLYLLKSVLNDWPDEPTVAILRRCAEAAHENTSIAILGGVAPDEAPRTLGIDMLVAGGKTRPLAQFTELARQAGLTVTAARTQASGRFVVECQKAAS